MKTWILAFVFWAVSGLLSSSNSEELVDLELVLAIDASSSIDQFEFKLQMDGIAAAFRDPQVIEAIQSGPQGKIAVSLVMWADATVPVFQTNWSILETEFDVLSYSRRVESLPRRVVGGTGIGAGIVAAIRKFDRNGIAAPRQVVDVSGDGIETPPREITPTMPVARAMALTRGVVINGLAILNEEPNLADWYRNNVIVGPDSFVISVNEFRDFSKAMQMKLLREIQYEPKIGRKDYAPADQPMRVDASVSSSR